MIYKFVFSTMLVLVFIQTIAEAYVPSKNLFEQYKEFLIQSKNKAFSNFDTVYSNTTTQIDRRLKSFDMSDEDLQYCEEKIRTKIINRLWEAQSELYDCIKSALDNIDRRFIKYWQYQEKRIKLTNCIETVTNNYNKSAIQLIPANKKCEV